MNLAEAKATLLVRAVETADREGVLLPLAVRDRCTAECDPPAGHDGRAGPVLTREEEAFVARRARCVGQRLRERHADLTLLAEETGLGGLALSVGALAVLAVGFFSRHVWSDRPLHLLNFPLLWLIVWNLLVYAWLVLSRALSRNGSQRLHPLVGFVARGLGRLHLPGPLRAAPATTGEGPSFVAAAAGAQFLRDWVPLQSRVLLTQARTVLHGGAILLTLGMIAGLLVRGFMHEYLAGWEATWRSFGAEDLHGFLGVFLAPASWVTGIAVPSVQEIAALRLVDGRGGGNAQDWILLYVAAALLYVVVPRGVLWWLSLRATARRRESFYAPPADDRYYRRLLQAGRGEGEVAAVFFHGLEPTAGLRARLREALAGELGGRVTLEFMPTVAYGGEAGVAATLAGHDERERLVAVFSLAATPEDEVQGELLRQLAAHASVGEETQPLVVLDAAPLERFEADGGFRAHYEDRMRAWERFLKGHGGKPLVLAAARAGTPR